MTADRGSRLPIALVAAMLLPLGVFISLHSAFTAESARRAARSDALRQVELSLAMIDARLERTRGAATGLAAATSVNRADWPLAYARAESAVAQNADWHAAIISDRARRIEIFDTSRSFGMPRPARRFEPIDPARLQPDDVAFGGIERSGRGCPCLFGHIPLKGEARGYMLSVQIYPGVFQSLLARRADSGAYWELLDQKQRVIARSSGQAARRGEPTSLSRDKALGSSGFYDARTGEGTVRLVAFQTSPRTGWSLHWALSPDVIGASRSSAKRATLLAGAGSLTTSAILAWVLLSHLASQRRSAAELYAAQREAQLQQMGLARNLHDGIIQFLTGVVLRLEAIKQSIAGSDSTTSAINGLQHECRREQRQLRDFVERLGPFPSFAVQHDPPLLADLVHSLSQRWAISCRLTPLSAHRLVPPNLREDVEFILREATANAVRHGQARRVEFVFDRSPTSLDIDIYDDGRGFPVHGEFDHEAARTQSWCPRSLLGRIETLGGSFTLRSNDSGVHIRISLPAETDYASNDR